MAGDRDTRTVAEVVAAQANAAGGCCARFAEQSPCDCLRRAEQRDAKAQGRPERLQIRTDDLGPLPKVHPRIGVVAKADADLGTFVIDWADRHGLTTSEALSIISRELTRSLERCVAAERKPKA